MVVVLQKVGDLLLDVGGCSISPPEVSNLWVIMDSTPSFQAHFKSISKSTCFFFLPSKQHLQPVLQWCAVQGPPAKGKALKRLQYVPKSPASTLWTSSNPYTPSQEQRSSDSSFLQHPWLQTSGYRVISVASLHPVKLSLTYSSPVCTFNALLRHHLFTEAYNLSQLCQPSINPTYSVIRPTISPAPRQDIKISIYR